MLVLSRRVDQDIVVTVAGQTVIIRVCAIVGGHVRIGIEAPLDVRIKRRELGDRKRTDSEQKEAA